MSDKPERAISTSDELVALRNIERKLGVLDKIAGLVAQWTDGEAEPASGAEADFTRAVHKAPHKLEVSYDLVWALHFAFTSVGYDLPAIHAENKRRGDA